MTLWEIRQIEKSRQKHEMCLTAVRWFFGGIGAVTAYILLWWAVECIK